MAHARPPNIKVLLALVQIFVRNFSLELLVLDDSNGAVTCVITITTFYCYSKTPISWHSQIWKLLEHRGEKKLRPRSVLHIIT